MKSSNFILAGLFALASSTAMANMLCSQAQEPRFRVPMAQVKQTSLYQDLTNLLQSRPELKTYITKSVLKDAVVIISSVDQPLYQARLQKVVNTLRAMPGSTMDQALTSLLADLMTPANAADRIAKFKAGTTSLKQALGEMSAEEVYQNTIGQDIHHIAPDSLLGRYLSEAAAAKGGQAVNQSVRTFELGPGKTERGPERLIVAIDPTTLPIFKKYFLQDQSIVHYHTERQGTLHLSFEGIDYNWFGSGGNMSLALAPNTILPPILLSTGEAQRASLFFKLMVSNNDLARHPWKLAKQKDDGQPDQFCAIGGYNTCTHWFGNIPLGDERVSEYMLPGKVDAYAGISLYPIDPVKDAAPRLQELKAYDSIYSREYGFHAIPENIKSLVKAVWQDNRSHMQLWQVLDLKRQQEEGELANPGYVAYAELAGASNTRVPVVFVMQADSTQPVREDLTNTIYAY